MKGLTLMLLVANLANIVRQPKPILGVNLLLSGIVFFMIDYKRVRHAFSENAGWRPGILEHFEILAPLTHPPVNKSAYVAFSGPCISNTRKTYKADIHQSNSKYSKDYRNNIQTHSHFSFGPGSPLKVSDLFKNGKLFSVFSYLQDPYTSRWKSHQTLSVMNVQELYVGRIQIISKYYLIFPLVKYELVKMGNYL